MKRGRFSSAADLKENAPGSGPHGIRATLLVQQAVQQNLPDILFGIGILIELLSSSGCVFRVISYDAAETSMDGNAAQTAMIVNSVLGWVRVIFWIVCSIMIRGKVFITEYLTVDPLLAGVALITIAHCNMLYYASIYNSWLVVYAITEFLVNLSLAGHLRILYLHYTWTPVRLRLYRLQRIYAPLVFFMTGAIYLHFSGNAEPMFVLYLLFGTLFYFELFVSGGAARLPGHGHGHDTASSPSTKPLRTGTEAPGLQLSDYRPSIAPSAPPASGVSNAGGSPTLVPINVIALPRLESMDIKDAGDLHAPII